MEDLVVVVDKKQDLTGKYFWLLKVLEKDLEKSKVFKETYWKCMCECGKETSVSSYHLKEKNKPTRSCGCLRTIKAREACKKYNKYDLTGEYGIGYTSKGEEFYFDLEDYDKIKDYCWWVNAQGYTVSHIPNSTKIIRLHKIVKPCDENFVIDHIDRNTLNNVKSNLRICLQAENLINKSIKSDNTSGFTGVWFDKKSKKWCAEIKVNKRKIFIGRFINKIDAIIERFKYDVIANDKFSRYYNYQDNNFKAIYQDGNKVYTIKCLPPVVVPTSEIDIIEITYEELLKIPSKRGLGCLGSSNK